MLKGILLTAFSVISAAFLYTLGSVAIFERTMCLGLVGLLSSNDTPILIGAASLTPIFFWAVIAVMFFGSTLLATASSPAPLVPFYNANTATFVARRNLKRNRGLLSDWFYVLVRPRLWYLLWTVSLSRSWPLILASICILATFIVSFALTVPLMNASFVESKILPQGIVRKLVMDNTRLMVEPLWFIVPGILATIAFRRLYADMQHDFGRTIVASFAFVIVMFHCYSLALYWGFVEALNPVPVIAFARPPSPSIPGQGKVTYYLIGGDDKYLAVLATRFTFRGQNYRCPHELILVNKTDASAFAVVESRYVLSDLYK